MLALVIAFVLVGEVLIFLPSIAAYRINWLESRVMMAEIAALAVEAAPDRQVSNDLRDELLTTAGVEVVAVKREGSRHLILKIDSPSTIEARYDLRATTWFTALGDVLSTLRHGGNRVVAVIDAPPGKTGQEIELAMDERPLWTALVSYAMRVLALSVLLALIVAALAFLALERVLVKPIRRLSTSMVRFAERPEDASRIITPELRNDEIGVAESELASMQRELSGMLAQKERLAALGLAVSKVSHDLRNMLSTAQIVSDHLSSVDDPTVKRLAPKIITSLDRAIDFLMQTLRYGRVQEPVPQRTRVAVAPLFDEVIENVGVEASAGVRFINGAAPSIAVDADREQIFRVLVNLTRNAAQALGERGSGTVTLAARREGSGTAIEVSDDGPGVPSKAREHLFEPFRASVRAGGTGLGLAIARELVRAHGGEIELADAPVGATFRIVIPDDPALAHVRKRRPAKAHSA